MVWVWIIVAIIVIALIIWFLMRGRSSRGATAERQSQVGRHASGEGRAHAGGAGSGTSGMRSPGAAGTDTPSTSASDAADAGSAMPVDDRAAGVAGAADHDAAESSTGTAIPADDRAAGVAGAADHDAAESSTGTAIPADDRAADRAADVAEAGGHDAPSGTVHTTTNYGSAADPTPDSASAIPADGVIETGPDAPPSAVPLVAQDRTGQESSALPADGSNEFDDVHDAVDTAPSPSGESVGAGSDEQIARENDDAMPRRSGAPAQTPAEAARHDDNEIEATQVEHPAAGTVGHHGADGAGHVWSDGHDPERAAGNLDGSAGGPSATDSTATDSGESATSAGDDASGGHATGYVTAAAGAGVLGGGVAAASHDDEDEAEGHTAAASAGQTVGYPVDSAPAGTSAGTSAAASTAGTDPMTERFGDGAASTKPDGSAPEGYPIKGNADSMLFHTEDSPRYAATQPEVWFRDEAAATSAGFAHWDRDKRGTAPSGSQPSGGSSSGSDTGATSGAGTSEVVASGTSYTVGTSHTGPAVTGLTGTSTTGQSAESAASDSTLAGAAPSEATTSAEPDPMQEQFGAGAASPREDGSAPTERHRIKGNADSMLFHTEDSPHYEGTEAEVWFTDEDAAKAAGFKHWDHRKR